MYHLSPREALNPVSRYTKCHTSNKPLNSQKIQNRNGNPSKERTIKRYLHLKTKHRKSVAPPIEIEPKTVLSRNTLKMSRNTAHHLKTNIIFHQGIKTSTEDDKNNSIRKPLREKNHLSQPKVNQLSKNDRSKVQLLSRGKNYLVKRMTHNLQTTNNKPLQIELPNLSYYISEVKINIQEIINNQEQTNLHLSHVKDSISIFQMFSHILIPKDMPKPVNLPLPQIGKITLLFDLDETLIHTQIINWDTNKDDLGWGKNIEVVSQMGSYMINLKIRPHVTEVLQRMKEKFQIGVFSASQEIYGKTILKEIDPNNQIFSFQLYRQHCFEIQPRSAHIKDLRILKDRDLSRVILIDNSPHTYLFQKSNAIPIVSFLNDKNDTEMLKLEEFLIQLAQVKDIRRILKQYFKLDKYHNYNHVNNLVRQLYQ